MSLVRGFFKDIPIVGSYSVLPPVLPRGSLVFLTTDQNLYISNGQIWAVAGGDVGPLAAQVAQNTADIATLQTDVTTLDGQVATNTSNITALQGQVATNTSDIGTLQGQVATNTTDITTLQGQVATNTSNITTLQGQVATNTSDITSNTNSINNIIVSQSQGFTIADSAQLRTFTNPITRIDVSSTSPTVIYTLGTPLDGSFNGVYLIQWNILAHYQTANVFYAVGQSSVLSNGIGALVSVFGTSTNQTNSSGSSVITVTADINLNNYRLIVTSDSAVTTTYSGYVIVTRILTISP
ncbi:putative SMC protein [Marseillevirus Shanghai 1]|nr:putative SMC protein [Marseillevirus Shanghai 1]